MTPRILSKRTRNFLTALARHMPSGIATMIKGQVKKRTPRRGKRKAKIVMSDHSDPKADARMVPDMVLNFRA